MGQIGKFPPKQPIVPPGALKINPDDYEDYKCPVCGDNHFTRVFKLRVVPAIALGLPTNGVFEIPVWRCFKCDKEVPDLSKESEKKGGEN